MTTRGWTLATVAVVLAAVAGFLSNAEKVVQSPLRPALVADVESAAEPIRTRSIRQEERLEAHEQKLGDLQKQVTCHDCALICGSDARCLQRCKEMKCPR